MTSRPRPTAGAAAAGGLVADSAAIAIASGASRVTGLLRIVVAASVFGSTVLGDLFVAVNVLPLMLYDVVAGSAISSVLVPPIVRLADGGGVERVRQFVADALGLVVTVMAAMVALAVLGRAWLAAALTAGVDRALADDATRTAGLLLLLILPQLVLYGAIGVLVAIQHANGRFLLPSAAPIVENLGLIATIVVAGAIFGGQEVDAAPTSLIVVLGIGSGLSVGAHVVVQLVGARLAAGPIGFGFDRRNDEIRGLAVPARDSVTWSGVIALRHFLLIVAAGFAGAGAVQALEIAILLYFVPVALVGRPIASAALPRLAVDGDRMRGLASYRTALRLAAWLAVPAGLALVFLAEPVAGAVARGRFDDPASVRLLTYGLVGLGVGAAADALFEVGRQATMAVGRTAAVRRSAVVRAAVAAIGIPVVVGVADGPSLLLWLGIVVTVGDLLAFAIVHRGLRSDPRWPTLDVRHWPRLLVASVAALVPTAAIGRLDLLGDDALRLVVLSIVAAALYGAAAWGLSGRGRLLTTLDAPQENGGSR